MLFRSISELSERIRILRREMVLCRDIAERSDAVEALVDRIEEVDERAKKRSLEISEISDTKDSI